MLETFTLNFYWHVNFYLFTTLKIFRNFPCFFARLRKKIRFIHPYVLIAKFVLNLLWFSKIRITPWSGTAAQKTIHTLTHWHKKQTLRAGKYYKFQTSKNVLCIIIDTVWCLVSSLKILCKKLLKSFGYYRKKIKIP